MTLKRPVVVAREAHMPRYCAAICLFSILSACHGREILIEDRDGYYVRVRTARPGLVQRGSGHVDGRPDLGDLITVRGDLTFICQEINGVTNPRIVIESRNNSFYEVTFKNGDKETLKTVAKALGLTITQEEREILALVIRISPKGHRLKPAANGKHVKAEEICVRDNGWPMDGITMDEFARFFEGRYYRPVVNLTKLNGEWSILLSKDVVKSWPTENETKELDKLGLVMRWQRCKVLVTLVKDRVP
jgi:hypothetical protein